MRFAFAFRISQLAYPPCARMNLADTIAIALVVALLLTMPVFALVTRGRPLDAEVARRGRTILLGHWVRDWIMWVIGPLERAFVRTGVSPDVFNALGALLGLAAGVAFARGWLSLAGWLILLGGAADIFDGRVARARGLANAYGAFLDSTLDRFAETFTFMGLAVHFAPSPSMALATALALGASLLVSYTPARGAGVGVSHKGGVMQRAERLVILAAAALLDPVITPWASWPPGALLGGAVIVIGLGALGTAVYRTVAIARMLKTRD
jgi:CDP-diacylglycerol--glycerol-3-phosphate 3-phosphatidyltransferase